MSATPMEKINSSNILQRLKDLEGHCSSQFGECAILLQKPEHTWKTPTPEEGKADPLLYKMREYQAVLWWSGPGVCV